MAKRSVSPFGKFIRALRNNKGWSQEFLSTRTEGKISQETISNMETGATNPDTLSLRNLIGLSIAFGFDLGEFARLAHQSLSANTYELPAELQLVDSADESLRRGVKDAHHTLLARGNRLLNKQRWKEALFEGYHPALPLFADDYERIKFLIFTMAQTYINLCDFDSSDQMLNLAENLFFELTRDTRNDRDPLIEMGLSEKRGWNEGYRGNFKLSEQHFIAARKAALAAGDIGCLATTFHFQGYMPVGSQTSNLFAGIQLQNSPKIDLALALKRLSTAKEVHEISVSSLAVNFTRLREGEALILKGDWDGALKKIQKSTSIFEEADSATGTGYALIAAARADIRLAGTDDLVLKDTKRQLESVLNHLLVATQHPFVVAEAILLSTYCDFRLGLYLSNRKVRRLGADACELVEKIYPYTRHPFYRVAKKLKVPFLSAMDENERLAYENTLPFRLQEKSEEIFYWQNNFLLDKPNAPRFSW